jgi:hypothetical protein
LVRLALAMAVVTYTCRYGEDHEPKEPREAADDGGAWDDEAALQGMLGGAGEGDGGTDMQSLD